MPALFMLFSMILSRVYGFSAIACVAVMFAIVSDIHSNIEALSTVLADIEKRGIQQIYCLGDVIGYGPNPRECLDLIIQKALDMRWAKAVRIWLTNI